MKEKEKRQVKIEVIKRLFQWSRKKKTYQFRIISFVPRKTVKFSCLLLAIFNKISVINVKNGQIDNIEIYFILPVLKINFMIR